MFDHNVGLDEIRRYSVLKQKGSNIYSKVKHVSVSFVKHCSIPGSSFKICVN